MLDKYLQESDIIDFSNEQIQTLAKKLSKDCTSSEEIAKKVFLYVRDEIRHIGDHKLNINTCKASDVLKYNAGWCYSKAHLVAALLRANKIPAGICYQQLSCSEYQKGIYCLHAISAVYLKEYNWYKFDTRGNKEGVDARFSPPVEKLAFELEENGYNLEEIYCEPLEVVVEYLNTKFATYEEMSKCLPTVKNLGNS